MARPRCEAEIATPGWGAAKEAVHLSDLCAELGLHPSGEAIDLHVDNRSAIDVAYNPEHHGRMKHVDRRHPFVRAVLRLNACAR